MELSRFDIVRATFRPKVTDDLHDHVKGCVGQSGLFIASWLIETGDYEGQWAMSPLMEYGDVFPFGWAPFEDLEDAQVVDKSEVS